MDHGPGNSELGTKRFRRSTATELSVVAPPWCRVQGAGPRRKLILFCDFSHAPFSPLSINGFPLRPALSLFPLSPSLSCWLFMPFFYSFFHTFYLYIFFCNFLFFFLLHLHPLPVGPLPSPPLPFPANSIRVVLSALQGCRNAHAGSGTARVA